MRDRRGTGIAFLVRRRDHAGAAVEETLRIHPAKLLIVVVDMWSYHWCKTWMGRASAMIPRMNRVFAAARRLGIPIVHAPTDVANTYAGHPARERMAALPRQALPLSHAPDLPDIPRWPGDMCGAPYPCLPNYGEYALDPALEIRDEDWISANEHELYALCRERGITHLLYAGGATNMCILGKPEGMITMNGLGYACLLARDLTEAYGAGGDSAALDAHTREAVSFVETHLGPSVDLGETLGRIGRSPPVDPVLVAPWGSREFPQFFDDELTLTLSAPRAPGAVIRYTTDGAPPGPRAAAYTAPIRVLESGFLRASAWRGRRRVSLESSAVYRKLPAPPPLPDEHLSDREPRWATTVGHVPWWSAPEKGSPPPPRKDASLDGTPLVLRGRSYLRGYGVSAPSQMIFDLRDGDERFVGRAGVCESLLERDLGRETAAFPVIVFKVFVDGILAAESIPMHISQEPWRFDVSLPPGSRVISLVSAAPHDGNSHALGNWVDAGFIRAAR